MTGEICKIFLGVDRGLRHGHAEAASAIGGDGGTPIISQTVIYSDKHYIQDSSIYQDMCLIQPEYGEQDTVITF